MRASDLLQYARRALAGEGRRTALIAAATAIGVGAVMVLTALGQGVRTYVQRQFSTLGTNLVMVLPGRSETTGLGPAMMLGRTPRDLTLEDALAIERLPAVLRVAPVVMGEADAHWGGRVREVTAIGSSAEWLPIRHARMGEGVFLPPADPTLARPLCVIGAVVRQELFGGPAIGQWLRIGDRRFRVIGVLAAQGQLLSFNVDEMVIVPAASAEQLFDTQAVARILVETQSRAAIPGVTAEIEALMRRRHRGELDVTAIAQDAMLASFDRMLLALTLAVAGIASVSLAVAGIVVMNIMLIAVSQRRAEIGLLKALGASPRQLRALFLGEAALLSLLGAAAGLVVGEAATLAARLLWPPVPVVAPLWALAAAATTAVASALLFTLAPAGRAARLDPVLALARR